MPDALDAALVAALWPARRASGVPLDASALGVAPFALATIVKTRFAAALVGAAWGAVEWLSAA
jgi:hypothetical protein